MPVAFSGSPLSIRVSFSSSVLLAISRERKSELTPLSHRLDPKLSVAEQKEGEERDGEGVMPEETFCGPNEGAKRRHHPNAKNRARDSP